MKFRNGRDKDFHSAVRARVGAYFEADGISRYGNRQVLLKALLLVAVTVGLYALILSNRLTGPPLLLAALLFGVSSILTAFNLAHDAAHDALTPSRRLNAAIYVVTFILQGANAYLWKLRHIGSHHLFPNVKGGDADLDDNAFLRITPCRPTAGTTATSTPMPRCSTCCSRPTLIFVYDVQFLFRDRLANWTSGTTSAASG